MFDKKTKYSRLSYFILVQIFIALMFVLSGCGNNIDPDVVDSNKIEDTDATSDSDDIETNSKEYNTKDTTTEEPTTEEPTTEEPTTEKPTTEKPTTAEPTTAEPTTPKPTTAEPTTVKRPSYVIKINEPVAAGTVVKKENGFIIDYSNISSGYVMVKSESTSASNIYISIYKDSTSTKNMVCQERYTTPGQYMTLTLTGGNGNYLIRVSEGSLVKCGVNENVTLKSEISPYVYPCKTINFTKNSAAVQKAYEICAGLSSDREKVKAIYDYVLSTLSYNYDLADQIKGDKIKQYVPNADTALSTGKGICSDYSCLFAVMLRCQGIPTKMIYGYVANGAYHAWNQVYYDGTWHLYDTTYEDGGSKSSSYTPNRVY